MDYTDLRTFLSVAECGSFSRAAEQLHLTQPAVTKRIQALEADLDVRLLDRIGRQVELTHAGRLLLPRARSLLSELSDTEKLLKNLSASISGPLRLATSHHVGLHRLAPVLKTFADRYDQVDLDIRFEDSEAAHDLIRRGDSELAVVTLDPVGPADLDYLPLWDDPLCFIVSGDHPLAVSGRLTLEELSRHPAILPGLATYTGRIVAELFADRGVALTAHLSTNYLETISMLVGTGLGWGVLPASMAGPGLVTLETDAPALRRTLGCVTNPNRTRSNAAQAFMSVLEEFGEFRAPGDTGSPGDSLQSEPTRPEHAGRRSEPGAAATDP
jgi:DNA-binding transcriptional LysR family regulator